MEQRAGFIWTENGHDLAVSIRGEIDHHTAISLRAGLDELLYTHRPGRMILDMSAVTFMDSSGLGLIMGRFGILREMGGELVLRDPGPEIASLLHLAGMERMVKIMYTKAAPGPTSDRSASGGRPARRTEKSSQKQKGRKIV